MGLGKTYSADYLADSNNNTGVAGQVLISTATGINWVDIGSVPGTLPGGPYLKDTTDTFTGSLTIIGDIRGSGQQLVLNAGESYLYFTGQTDEYVYINAEQGLQVNSSPDNWSSGWAGRNITHIGKADGSSTFGGITATTGNFTSTVVVDNMLTIDIDDISTGENRGLNLLNSNGVDQQWNITAGQTGVDNDKFTIRDSTNDVDALTIGINGGSATFAGGGTFAGNLGVGVATPTTASLKVLGNVIFDSYSTSDPDSTSRTAYPAAQMLTHYNEANGVSIIGGEGGFTGTGLTIGEETGRSSAFKFIRGVSDTNGGAGAAEEFWVDGLGNSYFAGLMGIGGAPAARKLEVSGVTKTNGYMDTNNYMEKILGSISFANGVADQNVDIVFGNVSFWGYIELEITGTYSNQNTSGKLTKIYAVGTNPATSSAAGIIYTNETRVSDSLGYIKDNIALGDFSFDGTDDTGTFAIRISHIVSTGNNYTVKVRVFTHGSNGANGASGIMNNIGYTAVYTATALSRQYVYYNDTVGFGTSTPDPTAGSVHINKSGTSGAQTIVATLGSTSLRPILQFSEGTGGGLAAGMSIEYNGVGTGVLNHMAINSVSGTPRMILTSGGALQLNSYTMTQQTGTSAYLLGVDASGNVVQSTNIPSGSGTLPGGPFLKDTTDTFTGSLTIIGDIRGSGQQLVLNAGESYLYATAQTAENVYANAEDGLIVSSSPDNWSSGWAGRNTTHIGKADGSSTIPGALTVGGALTVNNDLATLYGAAPLFAIINTTENDGGILFQDAQDTNQRQKIVYNSGDGSLRFLRLNADTESMRITNTGSVGIGVTSNTTIALHVNQGNTTGTVIKASGIGAQIEIQSSTAGDAHLYMRPNATGNNAAIFKMTAGTNYNWRWQDDATTPVVFMKLQQSTGTLTVTGDLVAYGSPSDKKLKENIKPIESALDKVTKLQGVTFDWKESNSILDIKEDIGFIAQDVQKVVPELVRENKNGMLSMRHQGIAPILLEAIKELKAEIDLLKSKPCTCNNCNCNI